MQDHIQPTGLEQSIHEIKESISQIAKSSPAKHDKLLSEKEVAPIIGMSTSFLQHDRQRGGGIPFIKIGNSVRYRKSDIDAYLVSNLRRNTSGNAEVNNGK